MLVIPLALVDELLRQAVREGPREACGLLFGRSSGDHRNVAWIAELTNVATAPDAAFEMDPAGVLRREREGARRGLRQVGCYHSHPATSPRPSRRDTEGARQVLDDRGNRSYVIVGPQEHGVRTYVLRGGALVPELLVISRASLTLDSEATCR